MWPRDKPPDYPEPYMEAQSKWRDHDDWSGFALIPLFILLFLVGLALTGAVNSGALVLPITVAGLISLVFVIALFFRMRSRSTK